MKKLILSISSIILILFVSGCQNISPNPPRIIIDPNMPTVTGIKTLSGMTKVALEWEPIYQNSINGYYIYRSDPLKQNGKLHRIATIKDRYVSHYVDTKLIPGTVYYYRMSTFSNNNRESRPSEVIKTKTMQLLSSVPYIDAISGLPHMIKLIWRPHPNPSVTSYIIQRNSLTDLKWKTIATVKGRLNAEYIDKDLPDNKSYRYRVEVKTCSGIISTPSKIVEGSTKPLPPIVSGLRATRNLPKRIEISWNFSPKKDISYYNVYRANTPYIFYTYLAKTADNKFDDLIEKNGVARYYKVTAVDNEGLESPKQQNPVMGTTLPPPPPPVLRNVSMVGSSVEIVWNRGSSRDVKYSVVKKIGSGFSEKTIKFINISGNSYIDSNIIPGKEYRYSVIAIDKFGIASKPTHEITIDIPKGNK